MKEQKPVDEIPAWLMVLEMLGMLLGAIMLFFASAEGGRRGRRF